MEVPEGCRYDQKNVVTPCSIERWLRKSGWNFGEPRITESSYKKSLAHFVTKSMPNLYGTGLRQFPAELEQLIHQFLNRADADDAQAKEFFQTGFV